MYGFRRIGYDTPATKRGSIGRYRLWFMQNPCRQFPYQCSLGKRYIRTSYFQGGVVHNLGMVRALEEALNLKLVIPPYPELTGAIGAALIAQTA